MAMSRDDYQEVADAVAEAKRHVWHSGLTDAQVSVALQTLERVTKELATACARRRKTGSGTFQRQKFVNACGFGDA